MKRTIFFNSRTRHACIALRRIHPTATLFNYLGKENGEMITTRILFATLSAAVGCWKVVVCLYSAVGLCSALACWSLILCLVSLTTTSLLGGCPLLQPKLRLVFSSSLSSLMLRVLDPAPKAQWVKNQNYSHEN